ncbi:MAG: hypothetical protein Kow0054_11020 [Deferrisoma sp.]
MPGNREEPYRAGITATARTGPPWEGLQVGYLTRPVEGVSIGARLAGARRNRIYRCTLGAARNTDGRKTAEDAEGTEETGERIRWDRCGSDARARHRRTGGSET